jgi:SAP domain
MAKPELVEAARTAGLPTSGTKEELQARLLRHQQEQQQPATQDKPPQEGLPPMPTPQSQIEMDGRPPADPARTFRVEYPISGDVFDHEALVAETHRRATQAGKTPRGGANSATTAHRVGFGVDGNGNRTAIYEISVRPE